MTEPFVREMSAKVSEEDVLRPYRDLIDKFNDAQKAEWARWSGRLPRRIAKVENEHIGSVGRVDFWQNLTYVCVILSAGVPIVIAVLIEILAWSHMASLLDAVFPAIVIVIQTKLSAWSERKHAYASVYSPYLRLLADIVVDIHKGDYASNEETYGAKWEELDGILVKAGISG